MIEEINITDLGVIKHASIAPSANMTVITGETGAGKTMLLTSIKMILGGRTDSKVIRSQADSSYVEAIFDIHDNQKVSEYLQDQDLSDQSQELILARKVSRQRSSRSYLNAKTIPANLLQEIGADLVSIHGQQDQIRLKSPLAQRNAIDEFGGQEHKAIIQAYTSAYEHIKQLQTQYKQLSENQHKATVEYEVMAKIIAEYDELEIEENEDEILKEKLQKYEQYATVTKSLYAAMAMLSSDFDQDLGVLEKLHNLRNELMYCARFDKQLQAELKQVENSYAELSEVFSSLQNYLSGIDADPAQIEADNQRYNNIRKLMKGKASTTAELSEWIEQNRLKYSGYEDLDLKLEQLLEQIDQAKTQLLQAGRQLDDSRKRLAEDFSARVEQQLHQLCMKDAIFTVKFTENPKPTAFGLSDLSMYFSSHPNIEPRPINSGASGGELSRIMLAIEVVLADKHKGSKHTFIFDEIDAGIGGEAGLQVGSRLKELSKTHQVIVVTHLPQVAAYGDIHYVVGKKMDITSVKEVKNDERVIELARMLSGQQNLEAAKIHAQELLDSLA